MKQERDDFMISELKGIETDKGKVENAVAAKFIDDSIKLLNENPEGGTDSKSIIKTIDLLKKLTIRGKGKHLSRSGDRMQMSGDQEVKLSVIFEYVRDAERMINLTKCYQLLFEIGDIYDYHSQDEEMLNNMSERVLKSLKVQGVQQDASEFIIEFFKEHTAVCGFEEKTIQFVECLDGTKRYNEEKPRYVRHHL